ncbi:MAG: DUF3108 domain-containing protein [Muribaculaceae bacterium]|jgi:hypothetical protein|nr:DUF3108 domain-containing protein [Muribaculaceae bacterium]
MKIFKFRILTFAVLLSVIGIGAAARTFDDETVRYKVMFKWGLINKQAGLVDITLKSEGDKYYSILTAASDPWADHFYKVRDTLTTIMSKATLMPEIYEKIANEGNESKHDVVKFTKNGDVTHGQCFRKVIKKGKLKIDEQMDVEAIGTTVDMLSSYYYMRTLPYETMKEGQVSTINIFSGKRKELLTLKYLGRETIKYDNCKYDCYHISFIFTSDGKKKTSDDMEAWITAAPQRIPVKLEGKLPVGKVRCFLISRK